MLFLCVLQRMKNYETVRHPTRTQQNAPIFRFDQCNAQKKTENDWIKDTEIAILKTTEEEAYLR